MAKFILLDILLVVALIAILMGVFYVVTKLLENKRGEVKEDGRVRKGREEETGDDKKVS